MVFFCRRRSAGYAFPMHISKRALTLKPSATVAVANRAKELKRQGVDVLSFAAGEPDFDTPQRIKDAAIAALNAGQTKYMPTLGDAETRAVIAAKLTEENGLPNVTGDHIAINAGGKHGLYVAMHCLFDPPDPGQPAQEALLPVPAWVSYAPIVEMAGGRVVELPTTGETDFKISAEQLRGAITPNARVLILNSPSNPCGTMYSEKELRAIARVVHETRDIAPNLVIFTDEIYEKIVYGDTPHFSIGSVPEVAERTITLNGLSKAYSMTGWRIGYTAASGPGGLQFIKAMGTLQGQMTTNITSFNYPAIRVALTQCADEVERFRLAFARRADLIHGLVTAMPGLTCPKPTGAFYVFPDVSAHFGRTSPRGRPISSALDLAEAVLDEAKVALVPGEDFGGCGHRHIRISFACSEEQIEKGMQRLGDFLKSLK